MASLSSNKDIFRKHFGQSGNQIDPSGGEFDAPNDFFMNEIGRDSGPFKVSVAKKLSQLKDQEFAVTKAKANSNNINLVHSQKGRIDSQEDNESYDISTLGNDKVTFAGVNDQYYDDNNVPKMSLVPEKEINTNNADYTSNVGDELISKERGIQYQEIGHGAGYVEPIKPINAEKDAASEVFMSNYNDDQVFQPNLNEALNNEILNTTTEDIKETVIKAEDLKTAEVQNSIEVLSNRAEIERQNNLKANKLLGLSDDNAPYVQDKEKGTYETDNMTVYRPREIEFEKEAEIKVAEIKRKIQAEKDLELSNRQAFQDSMMNAQDQVRDGVVEAGSLEVPITSTNAINEERLQASLKKQEEGFVDVIAGTTKVDMQTTIGQLAEERAEKERLTSNASTTPLGESQSQRLKDEQARERLSSNADTTPLGQRSGLLEEERLKREKTQEEIELADRIGARVDEKNTVFQPTPGGPSQRGGAGKFRRLQAEKQLAKEIEVAKRVGDHMDRNQAPKVGKNMWPLQNDPYSFSTLSYPPEATNSKENGHFMLFYVNVQNKTKYEYSGWSDGKRVSVGDYIERPGYFEDDGSGRRGGSGGGSRYVEATSGTGANAGEVDYQRQIVKNGGPGNILYNNMAFLSKGRKPKSGINSRYQTTTRITDSVALYLPSGIGNTTSASYGDFQTGVAGYLAMSGLDIVSELRNRDFQGAAEKIFGVGGTLITEAAKKLAVAGIETFTGSEGIQQSIDKAFGQTLNPYIEVAFNSTGMRTFDYTFKFAPKSKEETDEVQAIIQLFRFHMLPEMKSAAHRYLTLPSTFDIHYMWQSGVDERGYTGVMARENSFYNKIATCVLTNVDVDFTPNGEVQSFGDGAPTQIAMSLSFKETEMLTKQHIQEGF